MTQTEKQKMMLTAPVEGLICRMAVPTIISMLITALYNMADTYFVGKLGSNAATGAVGVALPLMAIIQATGFFFGHGSGNSISRHLGAGDVEDAEKLAACGFAGAIGAGLIICASASCSSNLSPCSSARRRRYCPTPKNTCGIYFLPHRI